MNVTELKRLLDKVEDPDDTVVVTTNHKFNDEEEGALLEVMYTDFANGEYVDYYTGEKKIKDLFIIY